MGHLFVWVFSGGEGDEGVCEHLSKSCHALSFRDGRSFLAGGTVMGEAKRRQFYVKTERELCGGKIWGHSLAVSSRQI